MQKHEEIKNDSVTKNFIYQSSYQVLSLLLPFITAPYISRVLGAEGTGIYSFATSILFFFTMSANLGISNYGNREIAANIDNKQKLSYTFWSIYSCHAVVTSVSIIAYFVFTVFIIQDYKDAFLWQSIQMFAVLFDITWFFGGIQIFKVTVRRNFIIRILTVIAIFVFIKEPGDVWKYIAVLAIGNFIGQTVVWTQLRKYICFTKVKAKDVFRHLKPLFVLFIPILMISLYRYMDKVMIPLFSSISQLGLYENSEKIITLPLNLLTTVGVVLLPKMSTLINRGDTETRNKYFNISLKYSLIIAIGLAGGLIGVSNVFAPLFFGEEFRACGDLISTLGVTILFLTWSNAINLQYLIPNKKDHAYIVSSLCGALVNLSLNLVLISRLGAMGAAIATVVAEFVVAIVNTLFSYKELQFKTILKNVWMFLIIAGIMTAFTRIMGTFMAENFLTLAVQVIAGGCFYVICSIVILRLQKDQYFTELKSRFLKRFKK